MAAPKEVIEEVKTAEEIANTAIQLSPATLVVEGSSIGGRLSGRRSFDYSTNDGKILVGSGACSFQLSFSKASDQTIYLYRNGLSKIARVKDPITAGETISLSDYDSTSRVYAIHVGEDFLARNREGRLLLGQILGIDDDSGGADPDEVRFKFVISAESDTSIIA